MWKDLGNMIWEKKIYMYKHIYICESYYPTSKVNHQFEITKVVNI